ncbi:uncharacterized protein LOC119765274 [Culex quinquefasciatus]|uniref:uncharacterized protein LOC119765274 n=1 Tax=Culex quinquefasciatus TaxID=7176 RepID=UPI0018E37396|nr:uncharacterized protein LOC119765274 [Culex quinquefasciatus]
METHSPGCRQSRAVAIRQRGDINQTQVTTTTGWEKPENWNCKPGLVFLPGFQDNRLYRGRRYWLVSSSIVSRISWIGVCLNQKHLSEIISAQVNVAAGHFKKERK